MDEVRATQAIGGIVRAKADADAALLREMLPPYLLHVIDASFLRSHLLYQSPEDRDGHIAGPLDEPPPVPTTSIFSRSDGICAWQTCVNEERAQVENIEVYGSHCGLGHHPAAVYAVADRLAQPEGQWKKFDRSGWKSLVFPDWRRS